MIEEVTKAVPETVTETTTTTVDEMAETGTGYGGSDGCSNGGVCRGNDNSSDADNGDKKRRNGRDNEEHSGGGQWKVMPG